MLHVKQNESIQFARENYVGYEYPVPDSDISFARMIIEIRTPEKGFAVNEKCTQIFFVVKGEGTFMTKDHADHIAPGSMVLIRPDEPHAIEGNLEIATSCTPTWTVTQRILVD